ncbi:MAG: helix-turn-helix domain-containing protein [Planctomycetota bacterium]|nr:helix-turn-helix domain-containing protein [Planctomycetota bacterium]
MTLVELAKPLNWSIVYLSDIERGRRNPPKPDDIVILLTTLGRMDDLHEMLRLADASRSSVRFDLEANRQNKEALADMLFALKRQVDQDRLESGTIECIRKMLESREDES